MTLLRTAKLASIAGLGGVLFSYNTVIISGTTTSLVSHYELSAFQLGITVSAMLWGTMLGSVAVGMLPGLEPRRALKGLAILFILSAAGSAAAWSWIALVGFRVLGGFAIGVSSVVVPAYLAEIAPEDQRGRIVGFFQFNIGVGVLLAYLATYFTGRFVHGALFDWRIEFGFAVIPAAVFLALIVFVTEKRHPPAGNRGVNHETLPRDDIRLFRRENLRPLLLAAGLAIFNQATGINAVLYYLNDILGAAGGGRTHANMLAALLGMFNLCLSVVGISLVDKVGRKPLLVGGAAAMAVCLFRIGWLIDQHHGVSELFWWLIAFNAAFGLSQGPVIWVFLGEIFPKALRVKGLSWGSFVLWAANGAVAFLFALTRNRGGALPFVLFGAATMVQLVVVLTLYPETKGSSENLTSAYSERP